MVLLVGLIFGYLFAFDCDCLTICGACFVWLFVALLFFCFMFGLMCCSWLVTCCVGCFDVVWYGCLFCVYCLLVVNSVVY